MKNVTVARLGVERAGRWLQTAKEALDGKRWDDAVYASQMAVGQSSKAVLFALGIDFPREHDVSAVFITLAERGDLPAWFKKSVPDICDAIRELAKRRGQAGYGFEEGVTVDYFKDYAPQALQMAKKVYSACEKLLTQIFKSAQG